MSREPIDISAELAYSFELLAEDVHFYTDVIERCTTVREQMPLRTERRRVIESQLRLVEAVTGASTQASEADERELQHFNMLEALANG